MINFLYVLANNSVRPTLGQTTHASIVWACVVLYLPLLAKGNSQINLFLSFWANALMRARSVKKAPDRGFLF